MNYNLYSIELSKNLKCYTVTELNKYISQIFARDEILTGVCVKGEISNFVNHIASGHFYFSIKDENSKLNCVMFKNYNQKLNFKPENGQLVIVKGYVGIYHQEGKYQLYVYSLEKVGTGDLYQKFLELKEKLEKKGYFNRKRKLPLLPRRIGIISAPTGAVICDIINILNRRFSDIPILLAPAYMQGSLATESICNSIKLLNEIDDIDVIIIARGGGSFEELQPFNEECVADAVFNSKKPIISAIGHQTDFTICDFTSDLRAPTPSAAAELVVLPKSEFINKLEDIKTKLNKILLMNIENLDYKLNLYLQKLYLNSPKAKFENYKIHIDNLIFKANKTLKTKLQTSKLKIQNYSPTIYINIIQSNIKKYANKLENIKKMIIDKIKHKLSIAKISLDEKYSKFIVYDYKKVLQIGYVILKNQNFKIIKSKTELNIGENVVIELKDGLISATVNDIK